MERNLRKNPAVEGEPILCRPAWCNGKYSMTSNSQAGVHYKLHLLQHRKISVARYFEQVIFPIDHRSATTGVADLLTNIHSHTFLYIHISDMDLEAVSFMQDESLSPVIKNYYF
uniref:Uncharacterized protein n=1 Tax=Anguilla anguilla TaxID=7936 RepID=A0A0E9WG95_ANGAN